MEMVYRGAAIMIKAVSINHECLLYGTHFWYPDSYCSKPADSASSPRASQQSSPAVLHRYFHPLPFLHFSSRSPRRYSDYSMHRRSQTRLRNRRMARYWCAKRETKVLHGEHAEHERVVSTLFVWIDQHPSFKT